MRVVEGKSVRRILVSLAFGPVCLLAACSANNNGASGGAGTNPGNPGTPAPTVNLSVTPASVSNGGSVTLSWTTTNAQSCTASGGWSGSKKVNDSENVGPLNTAGVVTFALTCTGPGGQGVDTASVNVGGVPVATNDCSLANLPAMALQAPDAKVTSEHSGICIGCMLQNPINIVDSNLDNFGTLLRVLGVAGAVAARVTDTKTTYPAGSTVGFVVANPKQLLTLSALDGVTLDTYVNGVQQEKAGTKSGLVQLDLLGLIGNGNRQFVGFKTSHAFNAVQITNASVLSANSQLDVYTACVAKP